MHPTKPPQTAVTHNSDAHVAMIETRDPTSLSLNGSKFISRHPSSDASFLVSSGSCQLVSDSVGGPQRSGRCPFSACCLHQVFNLDLSCFSFSSATSVFVLDAGTYGTGVSEER